MGEQAGAGSQGKREKRHLRRLETLMDVVFGVLIWRVASNFPEPAVGSDWGLSGVRNFMLTNLEGLGFVLVGMIMVMIYWAQNNRLCGNLSHTDGVHASLAIVQLFCLLWYVRTLAIGLVFEGDPLSMILQSTALAMSGFAAVGGWIYASRNRRLLLPEISRADVDRLTISSLAEPSTAILTIPFAFLGAGAWDLAWILYLPIAGIIRWRIAAHGK